MNVQFFELHDDVYIPGRWELGELYNARGNEIDAYGFYRGTPVDYDGTLKIPIFRMGIPLDFSHLVSGPAPIVSIRVAKVLSDLAAADFQMLPVRIQSRSDEHFLINVTRIVECIDEKRSAQADYWAPEDGQPDKLGSYRAVHGMRVDTSRIPPGVHLFRPKGWTIALVVSDEIRTALLRLGATGMKFTAV